MIEPVLVYRVHDPIHVRVAHRWIQRQGHLASGGGFSKGQEACCQCSRRSIALKLMNGRVVDAGLHSAPLHGLHETNAVQPEGQQDRENVITGGPAGGGEWHQDLWGELGQ